MTAALSSTRGMGQASTHAPMQTGTETRLGPTLETARYERARLSVTRGPDQGLQLEAAGRTLCIGSAHDCDVVLHDDTVSRRHCEIELNEHGFRVRDLGSTNGVCCAGLRIHSVDCLSAVELQLGETTLQVTPLSQVEDRERATAHRFGDLLGGSRHKWRCAVKRNTGAHPIVMALAPTKNASRIRGRFLAS